MSEIPAHQLEIVQHMGISVMAASAVANLAPATVILDGLIGYGLKGPPRGAVAALIRWANEQSAPTLALDVPSGVDTTNGTFFDPAIHAAATMTLALPKEGLRTPGVERLVGELYLADISVPPALYRRPPLNMCVKPLFARDEVIRLR
jgi:NAD(P)H-hydrate epimerase